MKENKNENNRVIAYYADEILDAWLNIGKHDPDEEELPACEREVK